MLYKRKVHVGELFPFDQRVLYSPFTVQPLSLCVWKCGRTKCEKWTLIKRFLMSVIQITRILTAVNWWVIYFLPGQPILIAFLKDANHIHHRATYPPSNNVPHKGKTQEEDHEEEAQVKNTSSPHLIVLLDGKGVQIVSAQAPVLAGEVHHGGIPLQKKSHWEFR